MSESELEAQTSQVVEVSWTDRWQVYQRLRELDIPCWCEPDQPLRVEINSATTVAQLASVLKQFKAPRCNLVGWLEHCWQLKEVVDNH